MKVNFADVQHGGSFLIPVSIIQIFGNEKSDPGQQAFSVKLRDGQSIHTNIMNLDPGVEAPVEATDAVEALKAQGDGHDGEIGKKDAEISQLKADLEKVTKEKGEAETKAKQAEELARSQALEIQALKQAPKETGKAGAEKEPGK